MASARLVAWLEDQISTESRLRAASTATGLARVELHLILRMIGSAPLSTLQILARTAQDQLTPRVLGDLPHEPVPAGNPLSVIRAAARGATSAGEVARRPPSADRQGLSRG